MLKRSTFTKRNLDLDTNALLISILKRVHASPTSDDPEWVDPERVRRWEAGNFQTNIGDLNEKTKHRSQQAQQRKHARHLQRRKARNVEYRNELALAPIRAERFLRERDQKAQDMINKLLGRPGASQSSTP